MRKISKFLNKITTAFNEFSWIDGLQRQVKVRNMDLNEIMSWSETRIIEEDIDMVDFDNPLSIMIKLFRDIRQVIHGSSDLYEYFRKHVMTNVIYEQEKEHL